MSDTTHDPVFLLLLTALIINGFGSAFPAFWNWLFNRDFEQEKRLAALKTKVKKLLRGKAANAGPQEFEDLADELDEMAQLVWVLKRKKRRKNDRVTSLDLLEAADMLRQAGSAAPGTDDRTNSRELIEKLRIRLSPREEQLFQTITEVAEGR
jgi:hypothetical protein